MYMLLKEKYYRACFPDRKQDVFLENFLEIALAFILGKYSVRMQWYSTVDISMVLNGRHFYGTQR